MQRVKTDILEEMKSLPYVSGDAWADILLRNAQFCKTDKDQQDFWRCILNPKDNREFKDPTFIKAEENIALTPEEVAKNDLTIEELKQVEELSQQCIKNNYKNCGRFTI